MIKDILLVGAGSCIGGIARYLVSQLMHSLSTGFPWGTFTVNIIGCLVIGMLWGCTSRFTNISSWISLFFIVGFCGGFTTFSTFSRESLVLIQSNDYSSFLLYTLGSVILGIFAVFGGLMITK